jgi:hypothetical protein
MMWHLPACVRDHSCPSLADELKQAWHHAQVPLLMIYPRRDVGHFYVYDCFLPIQVITPLVTDL